MRRIVLAMVVATCATGAWAATPAGGGGVVHLDGPAALAELRATNPVHYARARKIIAAANHLCRPTAGEVDYASFDAKSISCIRLLLKTSNPPKRQLSF